MTGIALIMGAGLVVALMVWVQLVQRIVAPRIQAEVLCAKASIAFNASVEITIALSNPTWLPCPLLRWEINLPAGLPMVTGQGGVAEVQAPAPTLVPSVHRKATWAANGTKVSMALALRAREAVAVRFDVLGARRGTHHLQSLKLEIADGFTLHRETRGFSPFVTVTVHPRRIVGQRPTVPPNRLGMVNARAKLAPTALDWVDLRAYRMGDSLRDVAWMVSARCGELTVLERATAMDPVVVVVASVRISELRWEGRADHADRVYEATYTLIEQLSKQGVQWMLYCDGFWGYGHRPANRHRVLRGEGAWTSSAHQQAGHVLGSLSEYASVALTGILAEVRGDIWPPATVIILTGYEDNATRQEMSTLRRQGYRVEVRKVLAVSDCDVKQGEVHTP